MIEDLNNKLLNRREVKTIINSQSNPGFENAAKIIAEQFKSKEELISVKGVKSKFGMDSFLIKAFIYNSLEDKDKIERKTKSKKSLAEVAAQAATQATTQTVATGTTAAKATAQKPEAGALKK